MKKYIALVAAAVLCLALLAGCSSDDSSSSSDSSSASSSVSSSATEDTSSSQDDQATSSTSSADNHITVGYYGGTCEMAVFTALDYGYLEDEGLDVDTVQIGYSDIATLMAQGDLDVYLCTPTDIMSMASGLPIYFTDSMHTGCFEGVASPESGIKTIEDLEGKTIAVDMIGSVAYVQICSEMERNGYDHDKVNWVVYDSSTMLDALEAEEVDGFCASDQLTTVAVDDYGAVRFFSDTYDDYLKDTLCCFVGMKSDLVDENPEVAEAVSRAMKSACEKISEDPQECVERAIEEGYLAVDDVDMCVDLVSHYTWLAGDEERYYDSFEEHLRENYRAGLLEDAPEDENEREEYYQDFIKEHGRFSG